MSAAAARRSNGSPNGTTPHVPTNSATANPNASSNENDNGATRRRPWDILSNGGIAPQNPPTTTPLSINEALTTYEKQYYPSQPKSLSGIAVRSLLIGVVLTLSTLLTIYLLSPINRTPTPLWRLPFFITVLSIFHFLEFWTTARYNTPSAKISSFLFTGNGSAYTIAHTTAFLECLLTTLFFPTRSWLPPYLYTPLLVLGLVLTFSGQLIRSIAMIQAGTNFNHIVQYQRSSSHTLVTHGLYNYLRHPSYFGFFWWGLGTQLVLGNGVCFVGYTVVLWRFFHRRVRGEEELLVKFFGDEYLQYRKRTMVGIPFV